MKITLTYDDDGEALAALKSQDLLHIIAEMDLYLREQVKYKNHPEEISSALQKARDALHEQIKMHELYELIFG